jgi:GT2 family glycosyltransferase
MYMPRVLISILNWNKAAVTLDCLASLRSMTCDGMKVDVLVLDNGSNQADYATLRDGADPSWVRVSRVEKNLGFTGGHNLSMKLAMDEGYDYIWLLNNDANVKADTLAKLVDAISKNERCGAVSPVIYAEDGVGHHNAWGGTHDWARRDAGWLPSKAAALHVHETAPELVSLVGTAILFRVQAIREVGVLDDRLFAYFDDNDISARLAHGGWHSKVVFDAEAMHGARELTEQPLYFFYLMYRNELIFWHTHMPKPHRKLLWLKLVNQSMFNVNRLRQRGMGKQADIALLGVWDFMQGKCGAPDLSRTAPLPIRALCRLLAYVHRNQLSVAVALTDTV